MPVDSPATTSAALSAALESWAAAQPLLATVLIGATIVLLAAVAFVLTQRYLVTLPGLVASLQHTGTDLIRVGDWIEMPQFNADGDVVDIARNTVKVQNWDRTFTVIPSLRLLEHSIKSWRDMQTSAGRRLTDVGTLRAHVTGYLRSRPDIRDGMTFLVRQLDPTPEGLPIQLSMYVADSRRLALAAD